MVRAEQLFSHPPGTTVERLGLARFAFSLFEKSQRSASAWRIAVTGRHSPETNLLVCVVCSAP
jgi:hypothetical protein